MVSEVMLQQTQVGRVSEKYPVFLRRFPSLGSLAAAPAADVIVAWQGLGYNRRAVRLRDLARAVRERHGGALPSDTARLEELPGLGRYTAGAVACFAFGRRVPVVDVNIRRVLSRIFFRLERAHELKDARTIWQLSGDILPRDAVRWNQSLMDLGSLICTAAAPECGTCPVGALCASCGKFHQPGERHRRAKKKEPSYRGIPRRLWRGRIVEILRKANLRGPIGLTRLAGRLRPGATQSDVKFFRDIIRRLERDGIVGISRADTSEPRVGLCRG